MSAAQRSGFQSWIHFFQFDFKIAPLPYMNLLIQKIGEELSLPKALAGYHIGLSFASDVLHLTPPRDPNPIRSHSLIAPWCFIHLRWRFYTPCV